MLRRIPLGTMHNLRDLGGYPTADGDVTAYERLLRGDNPFALTEEHIQWLLDREITTVIDLRSGEELEHQADQLSREPAFDYFHCMLAGSEILPSKEKHVGRGYFGVLDRKTTVCQVLKYIANAPGGVLFHCTAGKDRTGLIAALLLSLVQVAPEDVLADYQVSEIYLADVMRQVSARVPNLSAYAGRSKARYMKKCLRMLLEKYGSVPAYLLEVGLSVEELSLLKVKLLQ